MNTKKLLDSFLLIVMIYFALAVLVTDIDSDYQLPVIAFALFLALVSGIGYDAPKSSEMGLKLPGKQIGGINHHKTYKKHQCWKCGNNIEEGVLADTVSHRYDGKLYRFYSHPNNCENLQEPDLQ